MHRFNTVKIGNQHYIVTPKINKRIFPLIEEKLGKIRARKWNGLRPELGSKCKKKRRRLYSKLRPKAVFHDTAINLYDCICKYMYRFNTVKTGNQCYIVT